MIKKTPRIGVWGIVWLLLKPISEEASVWILQLLFTLVRGEEGIKAIMSEFVT